MSAIHLHHISKNFDTVKVLEDVVLSIEEGSFTVLLGSSGCGKTTMLRIIAGLEKPGSGRLFIGRTEVTHLEPRDRNVAMVFQNYALYPHLTVWQNIEYGLIARKVKRKIRTQLVEQAIAMVGLEDQVHKRPAQMSGGQRQRVALARAIVKRPAVFLMDEPLSNLDAKLRGRMRVELMELHDRLKTTFVYVTHDQVEAMSMGSCIIILDKGVVQQKGSPQEIYEDPANVYVAGFIGSPPANIIDLGDWQYGIRPEHLAFEASGSQDLPLEGLVLSSEHLGYETIYNLRTVLGDLRVKTQNSWDDRHVKLEVYIPGDRLLCFQANGQRVRDDAGLAAATAHLEAQIAARTQERMRLPPVIEEASLVAGGS